MKRHQQLLTAAIERDGEGQRALLAGDEPAASAAFAEAAELYRQSWEDAPPQSYGRLVGMLKSALLAGGGDEQAEYVVAALASQGEGSPTAAYARALAALILGDDEGARRWSGRMRDGGDPFTRTADAIEALAAGDRAAYAAAVARIVEDFEQRTEHLTGVAIADTAVALQRVAAARGMAADLHSIVLPAQ